MLGVATVAATGCSAGPRATADCQAQIRVSGTTYTSYGTTSREAVRHGHAVGAVCHDVGAGASGSVFPDVPAHVRTWTFDGYSPDEVLGVRYGHHDLAVFVAGTVRPADRERIYADLSGDPS